MKSEKRANNIARIEWQTVLLIIASYTLWLTLLLISQHLHPLLWVIISAINITLFMSITHEVVHGHPTRNEAINRLMTLLPIGWSIPYERFRDTHLHHHETDELTDPFDDPESWYLAKHQWMTRNRGAKMILTFNNTLLGRMLIGPIIGLGRFYAHEMNTVLRRDGAGKKLFLPWALHIALCGVMVWLIVTFSQIALWQWIASIYLGHSILLIRTFLEHQAAPDHSQRTVIIETPCPIAFLFLFNNYHFLHHDQPYVPWYHLPKEYSEKRDLFLAENGAYVYRSYFEVFQKFFLRSKEPVAHPFLRQS